MRERFRRLPAPGYGGAEEVRTRARDADALQRTEFFVDLAAKEIPDKLVLCGTGSSFTFTA
jgi:hypothetical protein